MHFEIQKVLYAGYSLVGKGENDSDMKSFDIRI